MVVERSEEMEDEETPGRSFIFSSSNVVADFTASARDGRDSSVVGRDGLIFMPKEGSMDGGGRAQLPLWCT